MRAQLAPARLSLALGLALGVVLGGCAAGVPRGLGHPLAGRQAPTFEVATTERRGVVLPARGTTRVTVVDFWASWCGACTESMPRLERLYRLYAGQGLVVIGVSVDDSVYEAKAAMRRLDVSFPVTVDLTQSLLGRFGVGAIPLTFVVDRDNTVRWVGRDPSEVERAVRALLREGRE